MGQAMIIFQGGKFGGFTTSRTTRSETSSRLYVDRKTGEEGALQLVLHMRASRVVERPAQGVVSTSRGSQAGHLLRHNPTLVPNLTSE